MLLATCALQVVDVPHIAHYYARFFAHAIAAGVLPLADLPGVLAPLVEATLVKPDVNAFAIALLHACLSWLAPPAHPGAQCAISISSPWQVAISGQAGAAYLLCDVLRTLKGIDGVGDSGAASLYAAANIDIAGARKECGREVARVVQVMPGGQQYDRVCKGDAKVKLWDKAGIEAGRG